MFSGTLIYINFALTGVISKLSCVTSFKKIYTNVTQDYAPVLRLHGQRAHGTACRRNTLSNLPPHGVLRRKPAGENRLLSGGPVHPRRSCAYACSDGMLVPATTQG